EDGAKESKQVPMLRYYNVFNADQCDGIDAPRPDVPDRTFNPIHAAERIVNDYVTCLTSFRHGGDQAYYRPSADHLQMPQPKRFNSDDAYYAVLFHELAHSTGHKSRLDRFADGQHVPTFGSQDYSREELIAEMTATYLMHEAGIGNFTFNNNVAYIAGWMKALRDDPKALVVAAGRAQKAADLILNRGQVETELDEAAD
ncbi:MAG: zincin-like metallopeptidase domain-containing protein, partial [Candidatus Poribacteria bacterium]|nr:zincin-like metallopeptidase domain-containing protein [Candidatus Poribacteria bacterium]